MKSIISVAVLGARGRMGRLACEWIRDAEGLQLVAEIEKGDNLGAVLQAKRPGVALDFTTAAFAKSNAVTLITAGVRPVVGASGLSASDCEELRDRVRAAKLGGLVVPNFSLGAVLMMRFAEEAARYFSYAEILEAHHASKADAPSGTARATAQRIAVRRGASPADASTELVERVRGGRVDGVPVHSLRMPGVVAHQEVRFGADGEQLSIRHDTTDRSCFRAGVILALRSAPYLTDLMIGIEPLLFPPDGAKR